jgi:hypothetical protein
MEDGSLTTNLNDVPAFLRADPDIDPYVVQQQQHALPETILQEAQRLTHGPRQADYSHPLDDYTRTAALVNAALRHKLRCNLEPEDLTIIMLLVKVSRQMHKPKRDNMVDAAGYAWCTHEIGEERDRREVGANNINSTGAQQK